MMMMGMHVYFFPNEISPIDGDMLVGLFRQHSTFSSFVKYHKSAVFIYCLDQRSAMATKTEGSKTFYGEQQCEAKHASGAKINQQCTNKGYYRQGKKILCGVHSSIDRRTKLPKNPDAGKNREKRIADHQETVEAAKIENQKAGRCGGIRCSKIGMMRGPEDIPGYLKVFPNKKHQNRKDGFGCSSLSPMSLGPVKHKQEGLPPAKLLENYHQFNKVYNVEIDKSKKPTSTFYKAQIQGYKNPDGQRRKYTTKSKLASKVDKLRTLYSIHKDSEGVEQKYDYVQSRYFYCHFYEELVQGNKDLEKLRQMLQEGTNIQIVGYDGFHVTKDLSYHYEDVSRPFGHELVLYTLLTVKDVKEYPWNKYYEMHKSLYPVALCPKYLGKESTQESKEGKLEEMDVTENSSAKLGSPSRKDTDTD